MTNIEALHLNVNKRFDPLIERAVLARSELTIEVARAHLTEISLALRDEPEFDFKLLIDVCGVDFLQYGIAEWETESSTTTGFERGVDRAQFENPPAQQYRFASV